jgi:hypothetical protein
MTVEDKGTNNGFLSIDEGKDREKKKLICKYCERQSIQLIDRYVFCDYLPKMLI